MKKIYIISIIKCWQETDRAPITTTFNIWNNKFYATKEEAFTVKKNLTVNDILGDDVKKYGILNKTSEDDNITSYTNLVNRLNPNNTLAMTLIFQIKELTSN